MSFRATIEEARRLGLNVPEPKSRNKYKAESVVWNGYRFDSKREAGLLIPIMATSSLWVFHPRWRIKTGADAFETVEFDLFWAVEELIIDVKGADTKESRRKRAAFEAQTGLTVTVWK